MLIGITQKSGRAEGEKRLTMGFTIMKVKIYAF